MLPRPAMGATIQAARSACTAQGKQLPVGIGSTPGASFQCLQDLIQPYAQQTETNISVWSGTCDILGQACGMWTFVYNAPQSAGFNVNTRTSGTTADFIVCERGKLMNYIT